MIIIFILIVVASVVSIAFTSGIHKMNEEHPEYKGEDFLDWETHTEDKF
jgi:hypothetical protein